MKQSKSCVSELNTFNRVFIKYSILFFFLTFPLCSQDKYSQIRIPLSTNITINKISSLGIATDHSTGKKNKYIELFVNSEEIKRLNQNGISFTTLIENWNEFYSVQQKEELLSENIRSSFLKSQVSNFRYGSMGGYFKLNEVYAELDSMRKLFPTLITKNDTIGFSVENRPIIAIKISKNPNISENEPRVFYNSLIHAREPQSMMQLIYFMWYLLENYNSDEVVKSVLEKRELHFVLCVNPDGYFYNQTINANGGGMWRKNRRANSITSFGVDLNRNYGYNWGYNDVGSSPNINSETFRGTSAFSEPETKAIKDFTIKNNFSIVLNNHSYSNLLIYPWGYNDTDTEDSVLYRTLSEELIETNRYSYGTGMQTVGYNVNGDADDWMYGETTSKGKIFSFTPEIGNHLDFFWPKKERILPINLENIQMNLKTAQAAGKLIQIKKYNTEDLNDSIKINLIFTNKGISTKSEYFKITFQNNNSDIFFKESVFTGIKLNFQNSFIAKKNLNLNTIGHSIKLPIKIEGADVTTFDTIYFTIGKKVAILADDAENTLTNWIATGNWGKTSSSKSSGLYSFTDSPNANSLGNTSSTLTLKNYLNLASTSNSVVTAAELKFNTKWFIESNYDFLKVQASSDSGKTWQTLSGIYTQQASGAGKQIPVFVHGYDGVKHDWAEEIIDLKNFVGKSAVLIRFLLETDEYDEWDGWYVDDIFIYTYNQSSLNTEELILPKTFTLFQNYPNPWNPKTNITFTIPHKTFVKLKLFDLLGREVKMLANQEFPAGTHNIILDGSKLASAIYFIRLETNEYISTIKTLLAK